MMPWRADKRAVWYIYVITSRDVSPMAESSSTEEGEMI
jgi:hypothetical protein